MIKMLQYKMYPAGELAVLRQLLLSCFVEISELNANNVDPDQTPSSVSSDLGLHCLPISLLWDARLKWVLYGLCNQMKHLQVYRC